jgi:hypothetical protein
MHDFVDMLSKSMLEAPSHMDRVKLRREQFFKRVNKRKEGFIDMFDAYLLALIHF